MERPESSAQYAITAFLAAIYDLDSDGMREVSALCVPYGLTLEGKAPTRYKAAGFSRGRPTVDWTNRFSHTFSSVTPFASAGLANTVCDTSFFESVHFTGIVSHFDGAKFRVSQLVDVGVSAYVVRASGQQKIISKIFTNTPTTTRWERKEEAI